MTQPELNALFASLAGKLRALGIPLSKDIDPQPVINTRAQRRLGCCVHREGRYTIQVSQSVLDDPPLLPGPPWPTSCSTPAPGCLNHGPAWKAYAKTVGEALGLSITRAVELEGDAAPLRREAMKYFLRCEKWRRGHRPVPHVQAGQIPLALPLRRLRRQTQARLAAPTKKGDFHTPSVTP